MRYQGIRLRLGIYAPLQCFVMVGWFLLQPVMLRGLADYTRSAWQITPGNTRGGTKRKGNGRRHQSHRIILALYILSGRLIRRISAGIME